MLKSTCQRGLKENDTKDDHKSDGEPFLSRCICLKITHAVDLLSAMEVHPGLVWLDSVCCETAFAFLWPHRRRYLDIFRDFASFSWCPGFAVHMFLDLLDDSLHKFLCAGLSEHLLKIHDVTHHFCMEGNRVPCPLLKLKMGVMGEVFICLACSSLGRHVVHTLFSIDFSWDTDSAIFHAMVQTLPHWFVPAMTVGSTGVTPSLVWEV